MKAGQGSGETDAAITLLGKAREAILHGGFDDLAAMAAALSGLIRMQHPPLEGNEMSEQVRPLIAIADILAQDRDYLAAAVAAYVDAAYFSARRDADINRYAITAILDKAELFPVAEERIKSYNLALQEAPAKGPLAILAKHKSREQRYPGYFRMRASNELPKQDEEIVESDLKCILGDEINCVVRQQAASGEIQFSLVVSRGFSRGKLTDAGIDRANDLLRTRTGDDFDRIVVPESGLPPQTRRDIDFLSRLYGFGIFVDPVHGRMRDASGKVCGYLISDGVNPERARYMGVDVQDIAPHDGKFLVPVETIRFHADPALIGKWIWMQAGEGKLRARVHRHERSLTVQSLESYGITPCAIDAGNGGDDFIVIAAEDKGKLNNIVRQHTLQQRGDNLLKFAEALPAFASTVAVAAYKDACASVPGLRHRKK